jgi:hypothetical protein
MEHFPNSTPRIFAELKRRQRDCLDTKPIQKRSEQRK